MSAWAVAVLVAYVVIAWKAAVFFYVTFEDRGLLEDEWPEPFRIALVAFLFGAAWPLSALSSGVIVATRRLKKGSAK